MIKSNIRPFQTSAVRALTPSGSPYAYTNTSGYLQYVYVVGGLLVTISIAGATAISLSAYLTYPLRPGDSMVVTYTTPPSISVIDLF